MNPKAIYLSVGRDYQSGLHSKYEYLVYRGENVIARKGLFTSSSQARRAGLKAAQAFVASVEA